MANGITNELTFAQCSKERCREILEAIQMDDYGIGSIDFNKIIPQPEGLYLGDLGLEERRLYKDNNWYDWRTKNWDTRTVMSGSVSQSKNDPSRSLQMIERPLMTADELKALPKGTFVVTKTGFNPIKVKLKLFFKWGIQFEDKPYVVPLRDNKDIHYASKDTLMRSVYEKYSPDKKGEEEIPP